MSNDPRDVTIAAFQPADQAAARELILAGLAEHWGRLDPDKNPDLDDIGASYAGGLFLVARYQEQVVGTGALAPGPDGAAEIVRMSVAAGMRRLGIGGQILQALCDQARTRGYRRVILETTATWAEVIAFYRQAGFRITHYLDGDVYFALDLAE